MKVIFLESCAPGGEVYAKGLKTDLPAEFAKRLIESGAAAPFEGDLEEDIHTAVDPLTEVKKAVKRRS